MIIGIVGSRRRSSEYDYEALLSVLRDYIGFDNIEKIVTGDCPVGGDEFAELIHLKYGIELDVKILSLEKNLRGGSLITMSFATCVIRETKR